MGERRGGVVLGMMGLLLAGCGTPGALHAQDRDWERVGDRIARAVEAAVITAGEAADRALEALDDLDVRMDWDEEWGWNSGPEDGPLVQEEFRWSGTLSAGELLEIKGVNGPLEVTAAAGDEVEIVATKAGRRNDPSTVRIDVLEHGDGVTLCAVYPTPAGEEANRCGLGEDGRNAVRRNDVRVRWEVRVPDGVRFRGRTVNGGVEVSGLTDQVDVATVNGDVLVATRGFASARTVNGSIRARMDGQATGAASFETVNGSIELDVDDGLDAELDAGWLNGALDAEIPFAASGRMGRRSARGTLGAGGPTLKVRTVNGSIRIF